MTRPLLLDLFCGAGGAAMGYYRAGFDVIGVDIVPQPNYPFPMIVADAMTFPLGRVDAIHASPPCQDHSVLQSPRHGTRWMLAATVDRLAANGQPWVVENVGGSARTMGGQWSVLCGSSFGLGVRRHRLFRSSALLLVPRCRHDLQPAPVDVTGGGPDYARLQRRGVPNRKPETLHAARVAMGIDWMTRSELSQAIPPAFTHLIGEQLFAYV